MKIIPQSFHGFWSNDKSLRFFLGLLVVNVFFVSPLGLIGSAGKFAISIVFSLLLIAGVSVVARSRKVFVSICLLLLVTLFVHWLDWLLEHEAVAILAVISNLVFLLILTGLLGAVVARSEAVNRFTIEGGIAIYLLLAVVWSQIYLLLEILQPGSFNFAVPLGETATQGAKEVLSYFSLVTLTTVGYGDVTAVHPLARSFTTLEAFVGQLYPAVLLARLVSLEIISRTETKR